MEDGSISWKTKKHTSGALSSTEAEYNGNVRGCEGGGLAHWPTRGLRIRPMVSPGHSRRQPWSTHARSISPSGITSLASLFKQDNSPSSIFQQSPWWMTRSQSRSLPLPRLIVHSSRVRVPGLLGVQDNQQHSSLDPPFCVNPRTPLSSTTAPNVRTWSPSHQASAFRTLSGESGSQSPLFVYLPYSDPSIPKSRQTLCIDRSETRSSCERPAQRPT